MVTTDDDQFIAWFNMRRNPEFYLPSVRDIHHITALCWGCGTVSNGFHDLAARSWEDIVHTRAVRTSKHIVRKRKRNV